MKMHTICACAAVLSGFAASAYAQSSTTLRIVVAGTTSLSTPGQRNNGGQQNELNVSVAGAVAVSGVRSVNTAATTDPDAGVAAASSGLAASNPELRVSFDGL